RARPGGAGRRRRPGGDRAPPRRHRPLLSRCGRRGGGRAGVGRGQPGSLAPAAAGGGARCVRCVAAPAARPGRAPRPRTPRRPAARRGALSARLRARRGGGMSVRELVEEIRRGKARSVYLFHGEEFLARKAAEEVVDALVDPAQRDLNLSVSDGASLAELVRDLATVPMFAGTKVVWVQDPAFLAPKRAAKADSLARLRELWDQGKKREAARRLLALAQKAGVDAATATAEDWSAEAGIEAGPDDLRFCQEAAAWAREEGTAAEGGDEGALERLLE